MVITIATILKNVIALVAEAKLGLLYECTKAMILIHSALIKMDWPQSKFPVQTEKLTADSVVNNTIVPHKLKSMNMSPHWL